MIFELGFFFAQFGRLSGRVIALHEGPNELPSDIQGVVWIGIDNGIDAAGEEIRREVRNLKCTPHLFPRTPKAFRLGRCKAISRITASDLSRQSEKMVSSFLRSSS